MKRSSLLLAAVGMAAAVFNAATPARAAESVKIGILWPLTGNAAAAGQASKAAIEVALDIINNAHPELANLPLAASAGLPNMGGAKLDVVFVDHQGNPSLAQQLATRLVTQDKVNVLMGAYQSSCSFTATAVAERYGIPFMVGESSALNITSRGFKWTFRATPIATDYARTYMRFFADMKRDGKKIDNIAIVNENTDYGTSVGDAIEAEAKKANLPIAIRIPYSASSTDVSAEVLQLKQKQPDVRHLHQLYGQLDPVHEDDEESRLQAADDHRRRHRLFRPVLHSGGGGHRPGRDEPQRLGYRQARLDDLQDQRDVQVKDRPRSR